MSFCSLLWLSCREPQNGFGSGYLFVCESVCMCSLQWEQVAAERIKKKKKTGGKYGDCSELMPMCSVLYVSSYSWRSPCIIFFSFCTVQHHNSRHHTCNCSEQVKLSTPTSLSYMLNVTKQEINTSQGSSGPWKPSEREAHRRHPNQISVWGSSNSTQSLDLPGLSSRLPCHLIHPPPGRDRLMVLLLSSPECPRHTAADLMIQLQSQSMTSGGLVPSTRMDHLIPEHGILSSSTAALSQGLLSIPTPAQHLSTQGNSGQGEPLQELQELVFGTSLPAAPVAAPSHLEYQGLVCKDRIRTPRSLPLLSITHCTQRHFSLPGCCEGASSISICFFGLSITGPHGLKPRCWLAVSPFSVLTTSVRMTVCASCTCHLLFENKCSHVL